MTGNRGVKSPSSPSNLGERLTVVARSIGSQSIAAAAAGVSLSQFKRYAAGENQPTFEAVAKLGHTLGIRLEWLATGLGPMSVDEVADPPVDDDELSEKNADLIINCFIAVTEMLEESNVTVTRNEQILLSLNMFKREKALRRGEKDDHPAAFRIGRVENHS